MFPWGRGEVFTGWIDVNVMNRIAEDIWLMRLLTGREVAGLVVEGEERRGRGGVGVADDESRSTQTCDRR